MAKKRKRKSRIIGRKKKVGDIYMHATGRYVREKLGSDRGCVDYRVVPVPKKKGRKVLVCITRKKGPRGGRTKAVALLRDVTKVPKAKKMAAKLKKKKRR